MANENDSLDSLVMKLKRVDDKHLASLSHDPAAQALYEEVTPVSGQGAKNEAKPKRDTKRRRIIWEGAAVVAAAVVVLGVLSIVNVFGANGPSIVEKAVAALNPGDNAIVHVKITGHESDGGSYSSDWTEENWMRTSSPYTRRDIQAFDGSPPVETVQDSNGLTQSYDAATNTIYQPPEPGGFRVAADPGSDSDIDPYRGMILEMLTSGDAVVEGHETVDGRDCLRIAATKEYGAAPDGTKYGTWYIVDAGTKNPVEWRMTRDGGKVVKIHFDVYEQLPATEENLALLDLAAQHPGATFNTSLEDYQKAMGIPQAEPGPVKGEGHEGGTASPAGK